MRITILSSNELISGHLSLLLYPISVLKILANICICSVFSLDFKHNNLGLKTPNQFALSILFILSVSCLQGQDFDTLYIDDSKITWQSTVNIDSVDIYEQEYTIVQEPIVIDDRYLLTVFNIGLLRRDGYYITFRDLDSGHIIWQQGKYTDENQFSISNFRIKGDILELFFIEEAKDIVNDNWTSFDAYLSYQSIDLYTGDLIKEIATDHFDTLNTTHNIPRYFKDTYFDFDDNQFKKVYSSFSYGNFPTQDSLVYILSVEHYDTLGHRLSADTIWYNYPFLYDGLYFIPVFDHLGNYSYYLGGKKQNDSLFAQHIYLNDFDSINIIDISKDLQSTPDQSIIVGSHIENNRFYVVASNDLSEDKVQSTTYIFSLSGEVIKKTNLDYDRSINKQEYAVDIDLETNNIYYMRKLHFDEELRFDFLVPSNGNDIDSLYSISIPNPNFSTFLYNSRIVGENKHLLYIAHRISSIIPEPGDFRPVHTYLGLLDRNVKTSLGHTSDLLSTVVYPNPVKNILNIKTDKLIQHYQIHNTAGLLVKSGVVTTGTIDLSDIPAGLYSLSLSGIGEKETHRIIRL